MIKKDLLLKWHTKVFSCSEMGTTAKKTPRNLSACLNMAHKSGFDTYLLCCIGEQQPLHSFKHLCPPFSAIHVLPVLVLGICWHYLSSRSQNSPHNFLRGHHVEKKKWVRVSKVMGPALDFVFILVAKNDKSTILAKYPWNANICMSLSLCNVDMWLQSYVATTTLQKEGGSKKDQNFPKCFKLFVWD